MRPMLSTPIAEPFSRKGWLFEPKLDGVRALTFLRRDGTDVKVDLRTRRGNQVTVQYPEVVAAVKTQRVETAVFDGEIVALNEHGVPDFQELQSRINLSRPREVERAAAETPAYYYIFDIVYLNGFDLKDVPLEDRLEILRRVLDPGECIRTVDHERDDGQAMYDAATSLGFEGVVAKRADSVYEPGLRTRSWLKMKSVNQQEFVVGGFTEGEGSRSKTFGGLLVGYYDGEDLCFAASVGSGLKDAALTRIKARLDEIRVDKSPFVNPPTVIGGRWAGGKSARCIWVKPELVAEVKFASWTRDDNLRAPVYLGLREDIDPKSVRRERAQHAVDVISDEPARHGSAGVEGVVRSIVEQLDAIDKANFTLDVAGVPIKLTNLDKEFWPATKTHPARTKRELIHYYARVAPYMLPHLKDRPLTLNRYPNGAMEKNFYQKHWPSPFPKEFRVERVSIWSESSQSDGEYILVNNLETLIWLAQLADIEIHVWMASVHPQPDARDKPTVFSGSSENLDRSVLNYPHFMVFDLDPYIYAGHEKKGEEPALNRKAFEKTRVIAYALKDLLQQLRLSSFVKTTGKTGLHIYVPVVRHYTYDQIRAASETIGRYMMQQFPDDLTMEWVTQKRTGKIFFDHNQNTSGKTLAAEYSLRPSPEAAVSAPISWDELARVYPTDFDIDTEPERLAKVGDLWAHIGDAKQDLRALIES
jgi:bifunctional non-homologous end joining protein LigD